MQTSKSLIPHVVKQLKKVLFKSMWQCNTRYRPNITKINTILANNMNDNLEETIKSCVDKKKKFLNLLKNFDFGNIRSSCGQSFQQSVE